MKNLKVITIITVFLVAMSTTSLLAQRRPGKTNSAKAAYGYPTEFKSKKKRKKSKTPKAKTKQPLHRKKNPWAS